MYGKIFDSIYEGTLYGQWEALVTFQQMIVLCDADGMIDMTPQAIAARTSIPLKIIKKGIAVLEAPDPFSRTPDQEGRRIELIDAHRPWGWHIVNHEKYMRMQDADMIRAQTRERVRKHRAAKDTVTVTDGNVSKRYTDTDTDKNKAPAKDAGPVWSECLTLLSTGGVSEKSARAFLGLMCRDYDEANVVEAVKASIGKANMTAYVRGVLRKGPRKGDSARPKDVAMP